HDFYSPDVLEMPARLKGLLRTYGVDVIGDFSRLRQLYGRALRFYDERGREQREDRADLWTELGRLRADGISRALREEHVRRLLQMDRDLVAYLTIAAKRELEFGIRDDEAVRGRLRALSDEIKVALGGKAETFVPEPPGPVIDGRPRWRSPKDRPVP